MIYDIKHLTLVNECYSTNNFKPLYTLSSMDKSVFMDTSVSMDKPIMDFDTFLSITVLGGYPLDRYIKFVNQFHTADRIGRWFGQQLYAACSTPEVKDTAQMTAQVIVEALFCNKEAVYFLYKVLMASCHLRHEGLVFQGYCDHILASEPLTRGSYMRPRYAELITDLIKCEYITGPQVVNAWPTFLDFHNLNANIQPDRIQIVLNYLAYLEILDVDKINSLQGAPYVFDAP